MRELTEVEETFKEKRFKTSDGQTFKNKYEAESHQKRLDDLEAWQKSELTDYQKKILFRSFCVAAPNYTDQSRRKTESDSDKYIDDYISFLVAQMKQERIPENLARYMVYDCFYGTIFFAKDFQEIADVGSEIESVKVFDLESDDFQQAFRIKITGIDLVPSP